MIVAHGGSASRNYGRKYGERDIQNAKGGKPLSTVLQLFMLVITAIDSLPGTAESQLSTVHTRPGESRPMDPPPQKWATVGRSH